MIQHTINIFKRLYEYLPPMVPVDVREDMKDALIQLEHTPQTTLEALEETMIHFGKKIWPYRRAFHEMVDMYEKKMGEMMLLNSLPKSMKKTYGEFIAHGGTYNDFMSGGAALTFFDADTCVKLSEILVNVRSYIYQHARQAVMTTDKHVYTKKIATFQQVQSEIEAVFVQLHELADSEQEHPELATEIRTHIRGFEYGLAALGPQVCVGHVCASVEYFTARKEYKKTRISCVL